MKEIVNFYNGQTDGFPHVKESRWENEHLLVYLNPEYVRELCNILPIDYFIDIKINAILCYDGSICVTEFERIFDFFGVNAKEIEP